ncbi:Abhydrolase domain-containing protein 8, partial [Haliaeetus albicilla]
GTVHCKRKITVYRNGQLVIENLGDAVRSEILHCQNSSGEPNSTVELELSDLAGQAPAQGPAGTPGCGTREAAPAPGKPPQIAAAYTFYALAEDIRAVFKRYAKKRNILIGHSYGVSFCTFLAHEYPDLVHKVIMINGGGPTALEPSLCSIFNMPTCVLHCLSPCLAWSFLKAGFARQGAKEKQLLKEGNAFNVSSFVLRAMMSGQYWPE